MTQNIPSFQQYQYAFTAYLRDPEHQARPANVVAKRMDLYKEIVFNNLLESVSSCFPIARKVLGQRAWLKLVRSFFQHHSASTPIFRKIPEEFIAYLTQVKTLAPESLPPYLNSLCHYEWVELYIATMQVLERSEAEMEADLAGHRPVFTPTMQLLNYDYAVQNISPRYKPKDKVSTQLLVYRDAAYAVKFIAINAVTYRLIALLQQGTMTSEEGLTLLAKELNHLQVDSMIAFGLDILQDLKQQGVIIGVYPNK